jgi:large subunit ribosomal protein L11
MAKQKEIVGTIKLQIPAGAATPAPPVGPALGAKGVNIAMFVKQFNDQTAKMKGDIIPVIITVFKDKSFELTFKQPPVSALLKKAAGIELASKTPSLLNIVAKIKMSQVQEIAKRKGPEFTALSEEAAVKTVLGTARSMGIAVEG